jgi:tetratricopeptide (TPR) repeat protein
VSQKKFLLALLFLVSSVGLVAAQTQPADQAAAIAIARGNRSFAKEDYEAALREYASVPASGGEAYSQALYNMGVSYYELWRTREAIDFYRHAIRARHGHYPRASYALGVALENQGSWQKLKKHTDNQ